MREADNLTTFTCRMSWKSGSLNLLKPSGPHRACYGNPLPFLLFYYTLFSQINLLIISKIISVRKWYRETHLSLLWSPRPRLLYHAEILHPPRLAEPVACTYRADNIAYPSRRPVVCLFRDTCDNHRQNSLLTEYRLFKRWIKWYIQLLPYFNLLAPEFGI